MPIDIPFECHACGLFEGCESPFMLPDDRLVGYGELADIMIIGEAPGSQEDRAGIPFVGQSGLLLHGVLEESGLQHYNVVITNVIHCRPPKNKTPTKKQIELCTGRLIKEIEEYDPKVVVLLGNTPLKALLGESGITSWRGVVVERDGRTYVPSFHPAYILRNNTAMPAMVEDFEKIYELISGEKQTVSADDGYEFTIVETEKQAVRMSDWIRRSTRDGYRVGFDTEITSLRPFDLDQHVIMMSFAVNKPRKMSWAVVCEDDNVVDVCIEILEDASMKKIGHNIKFDALACLALLDTWVEGIVGDSMLLSYMLDSQPGRHGLKVLAGRFLGMYDYDRELNEYVQANEDANYRKGGSYANVPEQILAEYAAKDAIATLELHDLLYADLTDIQRVLYETLIIPTSGVLTQMEANGTQMDYDVVEDYIELYDKVQREQMSLMASNPIVEKFYNHRMSLMKTKSKDSKKFAFNPNSPHHMRELLFDKKYFGLKPVGLTETGVPSTKWDLIKVYLDDCPFLEGYRYYKLLGKMLSTYLKPVIDKWPSESDDRVRSNYLIHGTVTGRLASRQPNLQNIPTPEKEPGTILESHPIKNIFTHTFEDGCLLAVDYSGMELRTMASVSQCQGMIDIFEKGQDLHSIVTCHLYGLDFDEFMVGLRSNDKDSSNAAKAKRYRAKWVNWSLLYGGSWYTLHRLYNIEEAEAKRLVRLYYDLFPEVLEYKDKTLRFVREHGYVESPFGRRRYLPYINDNHRAKRAKAERDAINMPIQSAAGDVLLAALIIIDGLMVKQEFQSMMVNTVHDSVMFDVAPGELDDLAWLCQDVMETIGEFSYEWFPGLDFTWFTVPLKVDLEVGSHYGSLKVY